MWCLLLIEYCYGRHFDVLNDHKPLQGIFSKSLGAPPRIQRFYSGYSIMTLIFTMFLETKWLFLTVCVELI